MSYPAKILTRPTMHQICLYIKTSKIVQFVAPLKINRNLMILLT
jgi:hypothetical protein